MKSPWWIAFLIQAILLVIFMGSLSAWILYATIKMKQNPDAEWKKHVKRLRARGIDPSYIKRSPEWEANLQKQVVFGMVTGILSVILTIFLIGLLIVNLVANA